MNAILRQYYGQLLQWSMALTRGDRALAEEIVQELCLYFAVSRPDLSQVHNLEGYLYTSLRHVYLSQIERQGREAERTFSVLDYDSAELALSVLSAEEITEQQNELRRICTYLAWRKESTRSACYLLLLFFHGYSRNQTAAIACVPVQTIYNKIRIARSEVRSYLSEGGNLHILRAGKAPEARLRVVPVPAPELFAELRSLIISACQSECPDAALLTQHYLQSPNKAVEGRLLAHIVSCLRCLHLIEQQSGFPGNDIREGENLMCAENSDPCAVTMRNAEVLADKIWRHRPNRLSIACDGHIMATLEVEGPRNVLRLRAQKHIQLIEIFAEERIRLAMLSIDKSEETQRSPQTQSVALSDGRRLQLTIELEEDGPRCVLIYSDPALADTKDLLRLTSAKSTAAGNISTRTWISRRYMRPAWALLIVLLAGGTYMTIRTQINKSQAARVMATADAREKQEVGGMVIHEIVALELRSEHGDVLSTGLRESWTEHSTGRTVQRLYDANHQLLASVQNGKLTSTPKGDEKNSLSQIPFWKNDLSVHDFRLLTGDAVEKKSRGEWTEISGRHISSQAQLESAALVLDHLMHVREETLVLRGRKRNLRLLRVSSDYLPANRFPNAASSTSGDPVESSNSLSFQQRDSVSSSNAIEVDAQMVELRIRVLYQLSLLKADVGEPLDVDYSRDGRVVVKGSVSNKQLHQQILKTLNEIATHDRLDIQMRSLSAQHPPKVRGHSSKSELYAFNQMTPPADSLIRVYLAGKGIRDNRLQQATEDYSRQILEHARKALAEAHALNRLGETINLPSASKISNEAREQWSDMTSQHAAALENEMNLLKREVEVLCPPRGKNPELWDSHEIRNSQEYIQAVQEILVHAQRLNDVTGEAFAAEINVRAGTDPDDAVRAVMQHIPLRAVREVVAYSFRLDNAQQKH